MRNPEILLRQQSSDGAVRDSVNVKNSQQDGIIVDNIPFTMAQSLNNTIKNYTMSNIKSDKFKSFNKSRNQIKTNYSSVSTHYSRS
jgi:flagellar biosynthesis/type III secretory pathway M-ring protein FliF/YscJ